VPLSLPAYGAAFFSFATARPPARHRLEAGSVPGTRLRPLPLDKPLISRGEFVRETLANSGPAGADLPRWEVTATLTKSQVDTFLFVRFACAKNPDLSLADAIVLNTTIPAGQNTPNRLLVILREKGGADYLASTGRLLGMPEHDQTWIPISRFQLAGWSKDENGGLDLSQVSEILVGWGGYLGQEGEQVRFTLAPPRAGRAQ
jgi:hypothetical protein